MKRKGADSSDCHDTGIQFSCTVYILVEEEQKKLLQFYCNPRIDFSHGEAIIPTRITCTLFSIHC